MVSRASDHDPLLPMVGKPLVSSKAVLPSVGTNLILVIVGLVAVPVRVPEMFRLVLPNSALLMPLLASMPVPPKATLVEKLRPVKVQVVLSARPA